jgi:hypothetical protein
MDETSISLCEQLYEASLVLLNRYGDDPPLEEATVRDFMRLQPYRDWLYTEILRIALQQNYVPESAHELTALNSYAHIMAEIILRAISKADYTQNNCNISKRNN